MKLNYWLLLFLAALVCNITAMVLHNPTLQYASKPLIVVSVLAYFIAATRGITTALKKWVVLALVFSLTGDVFLLFDNISENYFLAGLASFLFAHLFYIVFFHSIRTSEKIKSKGWIMIPVVLYYAFIILLLSPYLGDKKIPVYVYGLAISFMLLLAIHLLYLQRKTTGRYFFAGALLFVGSDSLLAINKFYHSFHLASILVIGTYAIAQLLICQGAVLYLRQQKIH